MKKYLLILLLLAAPKVWGTCDASGTMTQTLNQDYWSQDSSYQIVSNASAITICRVDVQLASEAGTGTAHIEVWNTGLTVQYGSDSPTENVTVNNAGGGSLISFVWSSNYPAPTGDFVILLIPSGDSNPRMSSSDAAYGGSTYSWYRCNSDACTDYNQDLTFTVYTESGGGGGGDRAKFRK